jgi:hypothetical protein
MPLKIPMFLRAMAGLARKRSGNRDGFNNKILLIYSISFTLTTACCMLQEIEICRYKFNDDKA